MKNVIIDNKLELERLESIIQENIRSFYQLGRALMEIRDKGLYRDVLGFETFDAYCKEKWDFNRAHAYRLMNSAKVIDVVSPIGDIIPTTESQARPLVRLAPDQQRAAWQEAVETAPNGKITAVHVSKIVKGMIEKKDFKEAAGQDNYTLPSEAKDFVDKAIALLKRIREDDPGREAEFVRIQNWIDENRKVGEEAMEITDPDTGGTSNVSNTL